MVKTDSKNKQNEILTRAHLIKDLLGEAKLDLEISKFIMKNDIKHNNGFNFNRRSFFFVQQALEKAVKSMLPLYMSLLSEVFLVSFLVLKSTKKDSRAMVNVRLFNKLKKKLDEIYSIKRLGHEVLKNIGLDNLIVDLYVLACNSNFEECIGERFNELSFAVSFILVDGKNDGLEIFQAMKLIKEIKGKGINQKEKVYGRADDSLKQILEYTYSIKLLSLLAKYEQSSRYPNPEFKDEKVMIQLKEIQKTVESFINTLNDKYSTTEKIQQIVKSVADTEDKLKLI